MAYKNYIGKLSKERQYEIRRAGGIAASKAVKQKYIDKYNANPNYCLYCGEKIEIKEGKKYSDIRRLKFCSHKCAAQYNSSKRCRVS